MKINNKIKENEKRTNGLIQYNINQLLGTRFNFGLNKPELLLLEKKIKNLKQFQKEIKELQEELKEKLWDIPLKTTLGSNCLPSIILVEVENKIDKIFKKRFGDLK